ncbi:MAG TPA: phage portal protein [Micromonosporaceae bacterium]|nr:phage portal protein [Micromonosporaceae bacterium]
MGRGLLARTVPPPARRSSSGIATPEKWVEEWFKGGSATASGVFVSEETALHYSPFFAGVNAISSDIGKLPLPLYERLEPKGKRRAREHPLYRVLHDEPNPLMPPIALRRTAQGHALTWGTGYINVVRNGAGDVTELWPLRPDRIKPDIKRTGPGRMSVTYLYQDDVNGIRTRLFLDEVLPIGGLGYDGIRGYSVVGFARQSIGLGLATEMFGAALFGNGARPGGVLKHPKRLSGDAHKRLQADWENGHRGLDRAQRVAILEEGVEWQSIGIPPEDAQFLETRRFGVEEMCRWLRIPPHKIQHLERSTNNNIEHQGLEYVADTLLGWLVTWDQSIHQRLLTALEKDRYFAEHVVDGLLRADLKTRYEAYAIARNWGWMSADDINEIENRNPLPDGRGETYLVPLNMQPAPPAGQQAAPQRCPVHPGCTCQAGGHA